MCAHDSVKTGGRGGAGRDTQPLMEPLQAVQHSPGGCPASPQRAQWAGAAAPVLTASYPIAGAFMMPPQTTSPGNLNLL